MPEQKRILIVEDELEFAQMMKMRLESVGYGVTIAVDAYSGARDAINQDFHLIILDLGIPMGGGEAVLRRIRSIPAKAYVPVVIVTGKDVNSNVEELARAHGVPFIFVKPYDPAQFISTIQSLLTPRTSPDSPTP